MINKNIVNKDDLRSNRFKTTNNSIGLKGEKIATGLNYKFKSNFFIENNLDLTKNHIVTNLNNNEKSLDKIKRPDSTDISSASLALFTSKQFAPAIKKWTNSVYNFNINLINNLPSADIIAEKIVKSYFYMKPLTNKGKKSRLTLRRYERLSLNRILVSKPEIKHTGDKILITIYLFNKKRKSLILKINKLYNNLTLNPKGLKTSITGSNSYLKSKAQLFYNKKTKSNNYKSYLSFMYDMDNNKKLRSKNSFFIIFNKKAKLSNIAYYILCLKNLGLITIKAIPQNLIKSSKSQIQQPIKGLNLTSFKAPSGFYSVNNKYILLNKTLSFEMKRKLDILLNTIIRGYDFNYKTMYNNINTISLLNRKLKSNSYLCNTGVGLKNNDSYYNLLLNPNIRGSKIVNKSFNSKITMHSKQEYLNNKNLIYKNLKSNWKTKKNNMYNIRNYKTLQFLSKKSLYLSNIDLNNKPFVNQTILKQYYNSLNKYKIFRNEIILNKLVDRKFKNLNYKNIPVNTVYYNNLPLLHINTLYTQSNNLTMYKLKTFYNLFSLHNNKFKQPISKYNNLTNIELKILDLKKSSIETQKPEFNYLYDTGMLWNTHKMLNKSRAFSIKLKKFKISKSLYNKVESKAPIMDSSKKISKKKNLYNLWNSLFLDSNITKLNNNSYYLSNNDLNYYIKTWKLKQSLVLSKIGITKTNKSLIKNYDVFSSVSSNNTSPRFKSSLKPKIFNILNQRRKTKYSTKNRVNYGYSKKNNFKTNSIVFRNIDKFFKEYNASLKPFMNLSHNKSKAFAETVFKSQKFTNKFFKNLSKLEYIKEVISKDLLYIYYLKLLSYNNIIFKNWFLNKFKLLLSKIYNKKVHINLISLKYIHLNSDIFMEALALKIRNYKQNKLNKLVSKIFTLVKLSRINTAIYNTGSMEYNYINKHFSAKPFGKILTYLHLNTKPNTYSLKNDTYNKVDSLRPLTYNEYADIINFIKYKTVFGVKLEASGRLTRRSTASRSVFKVRFKGNLKNNVDLNKKNSNAILKNTRSSNIQFTKISSKTRNGSFGIKGWINNA